MTQAAINYGRVLYDLGIQEAAIEDTFKIIRQIPKVKQALCNPLVKRGQKQRVIERVFPSEMNVFLNVVLFHGQMGAIEDIAEAYYAHVLEQQEI